MMERWEDGFGTVELVILTAILIGLALLFKTFIADYASALLQDISNVEINIRSIGQ
ncbi:MAG TPA: hypothetical protein GX733_07285 [Tissierellia bacterium]|nr:hypothetical protein [Tissierellia bacterium]